MTSIAPFEFVDTVDLRHVEALRAHLLDCDRALDLSCLRLEHPYVVSDRLPRLAPAEDGSP